MAEDEAAALLHEAQAQHATGRIDDAIALARRALDVAPDYVPVLSYLGTTLVTRRLNFEDGLALLERAKVLAPDDPGIAYSLGWCDEFAAYRLERQGRTPYRDPFELYEHAAFELQRCIDLAPEPGLAEDAQDLLDSIRRRLE